MINEVFLNGYVGGDPEYKEISPTFNVATFSLATSEYYTSKTGDKIQETEWHKIKAYKGLAVYVNKKVRKGSNVTVQGTLKYDKYVGSFGESQLRAYIKVEKITVHNNTSDSKSLYKEDHVKSKPEKDGLPF